MEGTYKEGLSGRASLRALVPLAGQVIISGNALPGRVGSGSGRSVLLLLLLLFLSGGRHWGEGRDTGYWEKGRANQRSTRLRSVPLRAIAAISRC
jgi:hypothetical protein